MFFSYDHYKWFCGANIRINGNNYHIDPEFLEIFRANHLLNIKVELKNQDGTPITENGAPKIDDSYDYDTQKLYYPDKFFLYILKTVLKKPELITNDQYYSQFDTFYKKLLAFINKYMIIDSTTKQQGKTIKYYLTKTLPPLHSIDASDKYNTELKKKNKDNQLQPPIHSGGMKRVIKNGKRKLKTIQKTKKKIINKTKKERKQQNNHLKKTTYKINKTKKLKQRK
jgi:hypothetical protein